jgi:ubiquinone/menaquinone biosynthesis C-methylase UbiE
MRRSRANQDDQFARIAPFYDELMSNVPYGLWADYIAELALRAGAPIQQHSNLLDLATGTGSLALQFARRGCTVTGIDLSPPMLQQAQRKCAQADLDVRFLQANMADFDMRPEFDYAICLYDSLNYILEPDDIKRTFVCTRRALNPGGLFIFDVNTIRALEAELFTQRNRPGAPVTYRWKSRYDPESSISTIRMDFDVPGQGKVRVVHRQRGYTDAELRSFLSHAGFSGTTAYEAYRHIPPGPHTDRVFYVARAQSQPQL